MRDICFNRKLNLYDVPGPDRVKNINKYLFLNFSQYGRYVGMGLPPVWFGKYGPPRPSMAPKNQQSRC